MPPTPAPTKDHHLVLIGTPRVGQAHIAYCKGDDGLDHLVSCSAAGHVCKLSPDGAVEASTSSENILKGPCYILAGHPSGYMAVGGEHAVKAVTLPSMEVDRTLGRSQLPVRALSFNPQASLLAMAGDGENIRLLQTKDSTVIRQLRCEGYVRSVAWDPEGVYVAATLAEGSLCVFEASNGKLQARKRVVRKVDRASAARCCVDWHPDGSLLAVAGSADGDVALYERLSWEASDYFGGGHRGPANVVSFSPNGLYAATGGEDACVCVWDVTKKTVISKAVTGPPSERDEKCVSPGTGSTISGVAWHPTGNSLAVIDETGCVGVWHDAVPDRLPSPTCDLEQLRQEGTKKQQGKGRKEPRSGGAGLIDDEADDSGDEDDEDEGVESEGLTGLGDAAEVSEGGSGQKRGREQADGEEGTMVNRGGGSRYGGAELGKLEGELKRAMRLLRNHAASVPLSPQGPIQPCSTPAEAAINSGACFLAYSMEGCIMTRPVDDHHVIELQFHDAGRANAMGMGRVPLLTDFYGFNLGSLGEKGALYASPVTQDSLSMLVYRPFEEWAPNGSWSVGLPAGECVQCVAAGASFAAAATSTMLLRLFSVSGLQTAIMSLPGAAVAMAAQGHQLAVVMHGSPPTADSQRLEVAVYDVSSSTCLLSGPCPLSPKATLTWLAFTSDGMLATADSAGIIRIRSHSLGGSWLPVWNVTAASKSGEIYWPVAIRGHELCSIMCPKQQPYPSVHPRPFFTRLPLQVPVVAVEGGAPALEAELMLTGLGLETARVRWETTATDETATSMDRMRASNELLDRQTEADGRLLKIFQAALKSDRQARAMDVVHQLSQHRALEGALKLANYHRASAVAERVTVLLQQTSVQGMENLDMITPLPQKVAVLTEHDGNAQGGEMVNPPSSGGGQLTALKQMASTATPLPQGGNGGENKRKPSGGAPVSNNPFARKPAKQAKI